VNWESHIFTSESGNRGIGVKSLHILDRESGNRHITSDRESRNRESRTSHLTGNRGIEKITAHLTGNRMALYDFENRSKLTYEKHKRAEKNRGHSHSSGSLEGFEKSSGSREVASPRAWTPRKIVWFGDLSKIPGLENIGFGKACFQNLKDPKRSPKIIGWGAFGVAYLVRFSSSFLKDVPDQRVRTALSRQVVIKRQVEVGRQQCVLREARALRLISTAALNIPLSERPVVIALGFFRDRIRSRFNLIMEYAPGSDLYGCVRNSNFSQRQILVLTKQCLESAAFCHRLGIVHRDVKAQNFLLNGYGKVILADFGLAATSGTKQFTRPVGTLFFMAPEVRSAQPYDYRADIFGIGCVVFFALTKSTPGISRGEYRKHCKEMNKKVSAEKRAKRCEVVELLNHRQEDLKTLLMNCRRFFPEFAILAESAFVPIFEKMINPDADGRESAATLLQTKCLEDVASTFTDDDLKSFGLYQSIKKHRIKYGGPEFMENRSVGSGDKVESKWWLTSPLVSDNIPQVNPGDDIFFSQQSQSFEETMGQNMSMGFGFDNKRRDTVVMRRHRNVVGGPSSVPEEEDCELNEGTTGSSPDFFLSKEDSRPTTDENKSTKKSPNKKTDGGPRAISLRSFIHQKRAPKTSKSQDGMTQALVGNNNVKNYPFGVNVMRSARHNSEEKSSNEGLSAEWLNSTPSLQMEMQKKAQRIIQLDDEAAPTVAAGCLSPDKNCTMQ